MKGKSFYLFFTVFVSGMTTLAVELSASRLLDPYFGTSNVVWANLIGLILVYLTVGYFVGGRLADRYPRAEVLYTITGTAAILTGLVPFIARPILLLASRGFATYSVGLLLGSFVGVLLLFAVPVTLLGFVSPFAIRLSMQDVNSAGDVAGGIYGVSTLGSILGTFAPVLVLIPNIGTRYTFLFFACLLLLVSIGGLIRAHSRAAWVFVAFLLLLLALGLLSRRSIIKPAEGMIFEAESAYNYIQVVEVAGTRYLLLNEGQAVHSVYNPNSLATFGTWDYFLVAPFFNEPPHTPDQVRSLCMIGLAAGTTPRQYTAVFGPIPIDGVEIDPVIVDVGRRFFDMTGPNLAVHVEDGRHFLAHTRTRYDVVAVDAYRLPYIPFHMTTKEFFTEVHNHLTERGAVVINVGRTENDYSLVEALATTMNTVFPSVYVVDVPETFNSMVVATVQETRSENLTANLPEITDPFLRDVVARAAVHLRPMTGAGPVLTDDRAPVEQLSNLVVLRYVLQIH
ncbi:MAG: fused MFS/spermidine synthase [Chloroflexota bacterium]|nr:fused MFS/spermidine synthase [Chloroflexota bacterium]